MEENKLMKKRDLRISSTVQAKLLKELKALSNIQNPVKITMKELCFKIGYSAYNSAAKANLLELERTNKIKIIDKQLINKKNFYIIKIMNPTISKVPIIISKQQFKLMEHIKNNMNKNNEYHYDCNKLYTLLNYDGKSLLQKDINFLQETNLIKNKTTYNNKTDKKENVVQLLSHNYVTKLNKQEINADEDESLNNIISEFDSLIIKMKYQMDLLKNKYDDLNEKYKYTVNKCNEYEKILFEKNI